MSSLEKLHTGRGSMQGHRKFSDGFSDTSSGGSFMDDTDREVSNLTDRAFRSLCIGEEAIYNDSEFSSPTERHKAFGEEQQQKTVVQRSSKEECSNSVQKHGEAQSETASTFQHSYVDVSHQEQVFRAASLSYINNGSKEVTWQQGRSSSRVSSLIKAFSSGECYQDSGTCDVILAKDKYGHGHESWENSSLLSIQRDLSDFSSAYHQNFKSGPFQTYRNHFYSSDVATAVAQMDTTVMTKSSKSRFKSLNSTNSFFHSEFSPFQLWEEYNRFSFESMKVSGFMSANEFPRWYDSPMYKELKDTHRLPNYSQCENRRFNQRQTQDVAHSQHSRSTVIQKAFAIEKRCESEMASNCLSWKKSNNFVKNKLQSNRPSTVSPTNEKTCRPDSSLFGNSKVIHEVQHKVENVVDSAQPSSVTPFNITQLLTPVIHTRQETETSEILQFAHTPAVSDYSSQGETDLKPLADAKHLRDSYKSRASSLLFNLKDNRKRVKSTYSPTKFKGLEITDRNKQPSKLEGCESRFSDILAPQETSQENFTRMDTWALSNQIQEPSIAPIKDYVDGTVPNDNLTLTSSHIQDGADNYKFFPGSSQGHFLSTDLLTNPESTQRELSSHNLSTQDKSSVNSEGQLKDLNSTVSPTRPEIANVLPKTHPSTRYLPAQTSEQQRYGPSQNDLKQRQDSVRKTYSQYGQNETVKERSLWDQTGSVNSTGRETLTVDGRCETRPFGGEIAALIEMDKHRKAIAKQYLPSTNNGYSARKETYMQKVNEDIKLGRRAEEEEKEVKQDTISSRKSSYSGTSLHNNQLNTFSRATDLYGKKQNKTSSPPKDVHAYSGLQRYSEKNGLAERDPYSLSNSMPTQKTSDEKSLYVRSEENKSQNNDGSFSYQQYRYEANKQWHMTSASEDKRIKDNVWTHRQLEKTAHMLEHNGSKSYKISNMMSSTQQSPQHTSTRQNKSSKKDALSNPSLEDNGSVTENNPSRREDRFSINDILAIRDSEQAKRIKENTFAGDLDRSENKQNQIKHDTAEEKLTITGAIKEQGAQGYTVPDYVIPAPGYLRKDFSNANEGLANITTDRKDKVMSKNNDRVTTRALSYKEKGQTKQEILTSKLKAHAQKEISAIKEKGLAKQGIPARNTAKPSMTVNSEIAQDGQEVNFAKKEITTDKLNHLFQDITYSSVTQHKELNKTHNDHSANGFPSRRYSQEDIQSTALDMKKSECETQEKPLATERQHDSLKYDKPPGEEEFTQNVQVGDDATVKNTKTIQTTDLTEKEPPKHHLIGNAEASSPTQYNNSEVVTTPNNISTTKMDEKSPTKTSIENQKANNSLNKTSQMSTNGRHGLLGLDRNEPNVEQATVHHKSGITAAVEQSKNELIKNSSAINVSQQTSSSNDTKYKNGNPAAKLLTESDSHLQSTTMNADDERFRNHNYKQNSGLKSGVTPTLSLDNSATANDQFSSRSTKPEALENLDEDGKNDFKRKQHKLSPVKVAESTPANKMLESPSKSEPNKDTVQSLKQMVSEKAKESCQQKDDNTAFLLPVSKNEKHLENNNEQFKEVSRDERLPVSASHTDTKPTGILCKEEPSMKESQKVTSEITGSPHGSKSPTETNAFTQNTVTTGEGTTQNNVDSTNDLTFSQLEPEEPMIFSICVSSKIENTSNDEPMIYTICVSSNSQNDKQQNPAKQDDIGSAEIEPSAEDEKVKTDKAENNHDGNESFGHSETEVPLKSKAEKEHIVRNREPPANTDKQDHHKPTEIGSIGTSYENLLAKYGLPVRNHGHLTPTDHMEDKKDMKEKEPEVDLSQKPMKHETNRSLPSKEKSPDNTKIHPEDSRQTSDQQTSFEETQLLKMSDNKIKQQANSSVKEKHCEIPLITSHPKHIGNAEKQDQDTKNEAKQSRRTGDVQLMDKKVEEHVRNTEKLQRLRKIENITDNASYSRKSPLKTEDVSVTAKQPAVISDSTNTAKTAKHINTKLNETITNANKNPQKVNTEDKKFLAQNTTTKDQKTEYCAKQDESVTAKDAQVLKNSKKRDFEEKKPQPDKKQAGFNTHNEITNRMNTVSKDAADTHVNNYSGKVTSIGEDVCTVVKHEQTSFDAPKIHLNNIKVSTEEVSSKQELRVDHKSQHEVIKKESLRVMREAVVTENRADKDFTKQRNSPVKSPTVKNAPQILSNMKGTGEKTPKEKDDFEKEITPRKKDNPEQVQSLLRQVSEKGRREDSGILSPSGHLNKNDGDMKVNENSSSIRGKKERNAENMKKQLTDRTSTNQHQSERRRPLETKEIVSYEQGYSSQQGIKSEVKPEAAQRSKKVTRPEISALADYARLKVISAEEDKKEINILPKMDVHYSHDQSSTGLRKNSHGNVSGGEPKREAHDAKPLQFQERDKETFLSQKQNYSKPSTSTAQPKRNEGFDGKQEKGLTHVKDSNTTSSFTEPTNREVRHKIYHSKNLQDSLPVQTEGRSGHSRSRQIAQEKATEKENPSHSGRQKSQANLPYQAVSAAVKTEENQINMTSPAGEEMEELQYYTVNALDSDTKPKETSQASPSSHKITHNKDSVHKLEEEKKEDYRKDMTGQQSNSSSPAMGKPIMFRVKDNTIRTTSVTKTVKPRFHRSFSDDLRIGSPTGHLSSSEKGDEKEPVSPSVLHEPATAAPHRLHKVEETQIQNNLPAAEHTAKQLKSHQRRSQNLNDEDDVENCTASTSAAHIPKIESYRDTYQRPASVCYDRPESSCYERPESACSDIRPLGKPPTVPPKSEKALRRAQKLTTRRMKKAESKMTSENQEELASKSITDVSSVPSSPSDTLSTHLAQVTPPFSSYGTEPNYTTPMQSTMAHPFTMTHRKLLQDPNSGQYFMVDMPLPVKTKTFYDPETGKYVQLNVRPRSQSAHSQPVPVEVLNGPYMLYPGFLPMAASSLPSVRSSSQLSAPGTLTADQSDTGTDLQKQNQQNYSRDSRRHPESVSRSREQIHDPSMNVQNNTSGSERHTDIITMSELEDFAMEST